MKMPFALVVVTALIAVTGAIAAAADYIYPHFSPAKVDLIRLQPCADHGGMKFGPALSLDEDTVLVALFTCNDDRLVLVTDMRPGAGTAIGKQTASIQVQLDAPTGTIGHGFVLGGGWALECGHQLPAINVRVDGVNMDMPVTRGERKDVVATNACAGSDVGFSFWLDTSALTHGTHVVQVQAADDQGLMALSNPLTISLP